MPKTFLFYPMVALAIVCISWGAILIRLAGEASVLTIAAWRLIAASILLLPIAARRGTPWTMPRHQLLLSAAGGLFLALHFVFWITSLQHTTVASSVVLVASSPVFVGIGSRIILRERLRPKLAAGIVLSVAGAVVIGWGDVRIAGSALYGDGFALLGALMYAGYLLVGRHVRRTENLLNYIFVNYTVAAVLLGAVWLASGQSIAGFAPITYIYLALLAIGPQLVGHTTFNWALEYLSAPTVAVLSLGEPILASVLAYLVFTERVTSLKTLGGVIILAGIYLSIREERQRHATG